MQEIKEIDIWCEMTHFGCFYCIIDKKTKSQHVDPKLTHGQLCILSHKMSNNKS